MIQAEISSIKFLTIHSSIVVFYTKKAKLRLEKIYMEHKRRVQSAKLNHPMGNKATTVGDARRQILSSGRGFFHRTNRLT